MNKHKHIHKFKKKTYPSKVSMFFCTLPDCYFKVESDTTIGKESLCNICNEPFIMNEKSTKLLRPHCNDCGSRAVIDSDGKKRFVRFKKGGRILAAVAVEEVNNLRSRLDSISKTDEDI